MACLDGNNGLMTRWGYSTINPMVPYVSATYISRWNSPNCGKCYQIAGWAKTIYVTAIDQCRPGPSGEMNFNIHPDGYHALLRAVGLSLTKRLPHRFVRETKAKTLQHWLLRWKYISLTYFPLSTTSEKV